MSEHADTVLRSFGLIPTAIDALGNGDGFSGAAIWRTESALGTQCLRAWPESTSESRLRFIQHLQTTAAAELIFVPQVLPTWDGKPWVVHQGRLWELSSWMPGQADLSEHPSLRHVNDACDALARIHLVWERVHPQRGFCPAIARRLDALRQWQRAAHSLDQLGALSTRALLVLNRWIREVPAELSHWQHEEMPLQPCLCDIRRNHVLFKYDRVRAIIDYGEVKIDHVAVDLARLLGSLVGDDADGWRTGLAAYRFVRPLSTRDEELARMLDRTGTILGVANWLRWLHHEQRSFDNYDAALQRLAVLVARLERW